MKTIDFNSDDSVPLNLLANGKYFEVAEDLEIITGSDLISTATIPAGFITDLASIPTFFGVFGIAKLGRYSIPAIFHDYCSQQTNIPLHTIDKVFYTLMINYKVSVPLAQLIFAAVTVYNFIAFNREFGWRKRPARLLQRADVL